MWGNFRKAPNWSILSEAILSQICRVQHHCALWWWPHSTVSFSATSFKGNLKAGESLPFKLENKKAVMITTDSALVTKYDVGWKYPLFGLCLKSICFLFIFTYFIYTGIQDSSFLKFTWSCNNMYVLKLAMRIPHMQFQAEMRLCASDIHIYALLFSYSSCFYAVSYG